MNTELTMLTLLIVMAACVGVALYYKQELETKEDKYSFNDAYKTLLQNEIKELRLENLKLKDQLAIDSMYKNYTKPVADKDMVEAVKYAMKKAHPDNGGKQEDFIKFNNLYNKIR